MTKSKYFILLAALFATALLLCSCRSSGSNYSRSDHKHTDDGRIGTSDGYGYNNGKFNAGVTDGTVTGGDTVGNSVKTRKNSKAVGEKDGMTGTKDGAVGRAVKGTADMTRDVADGIGDGIKDVGRGIKNGAGAVMNGIDSRNAGGAGNPNYTR